MPRFKVLRRVDAYVDYVAEVSALSANEASAKASESEESFDWVEQDVQQFDARLFVTLDDDGNEVAGTECGDFA